MKNKEIYENYHRTFELMNSVLELMPKLSENQSEANKVLSDNLTSTSNKIIDALTAEKQIEPSIIEHLLETLKYNNEEVRNALRNQNLLEKSRIEFYVKLTEIQKIYAKMCKEEFKSSQ